MGTLTQWTKLALEGGELSDEDAAALDRHLSRVPADLDSRIRMLGYCAKNRFHSSVAAEMRLAHLIWIVENRPELPIAGSPFCDCIIDVDGKTAYKEVKIRWLRQIDTGNCTVAALKNAAHFFIQHDKELAAKFLTRAKILAPTDFEIDSDLAFLKRMPAGPEE